MEVPLLDKLSLFRSEAEMDQEEESAAAAAAATMTIDEQPPSTWGENGVGWSNKKKMLSKQLSMRETTREAKWEKRRRQILHKRRMMITLNVHHHDGNDDNDDHDDHDHDVEGEDEEEELEVKAVDGSGRKMSIIERRMRRRKVRSLTDEDLDELRGSMELGFGFNEEDGGHNLCQTLPALDLYFAVNRQLSDPKLHFSPSPASTPTPTSSSSTICGTPSPRSPNHQQQADAWMICNPGDNPQHVKTRLRHWAQVVACSVRHCC